MLVTPENPEEDLIAESDVNRSSTKIRSLMHL